MDSLYGRRTNPSLGSLNDPSASASSPRNATLPRRFGGDSSSHGKANPVNPATTPGGRLVSPTGGASSAFGLGSGAFSSFGSSAKTPKPTGNPFDSGFKAATSPAAAASSAGAQKLSAKSTAVGSGAGPAGGNTTGAAAPAGGDKNRRYPLRNEWVFWFRPPISKANGYIEYEKTLHSMASVSTVEDFFAVYTHLKRPSTLPLVSDYHLFRRGIRPIWEDAENRKGGKWIVRLKKGVADRYWEDLLFAIIGDQFGDANDEVCGAVLSVRNGEDILSVWARNDGGRVLRIRETMKRVLCLPLDTKLEWKSHDSSIQQRSAIEESRREKPNNHHHNHNNNSNNDGSGQRHSHHHSSNHHGHSQHQHQHQHQHQQSDKRSGKQSYSSRVGGGDEQQQQTHGHGTP
ncbi:Translation Initiation factor eIF- 4e [Niveomyces insectorum RCEF 264]|uniref:Translation Initiation factor eIF-4e n=1 Tax=Niveomyces insectorum RCEF 264 TaxID=1081102 RepID=A0A167TZS9_9HYPO|nr:Translation Initiation factor eIF- 4e [Niveomyces insectorum RCEF 264]